MLTTSWWYAKKKIPAARPISVLLRKRVQRIPASPSVSTGDLQCRKQSCQQGSALGQRANNYVFPRTMRAFADSAQAIECWHSQRCRDISVRPAADEGFSQCYAHFFRQRASLRVERGAHLSLHRRAVESTADFEFCARKDRPQRVEFSFKRAHIFNTCRAQIHQGARAFRNNI